MENATKALLIAASVLIALLLIAVGLRVFNSTKGTVESAQTTMDATAITTFNTQFSGYLGKLITATQANTLLQKIISSNAVNPTHKVKFCGLDTLSMGIAESGTYKADTDSNGYIINIYK